MSRHRASVVAISLLSLTSCVSAGGGALVLYEENDALSLSDKTDRYYTQGLRLTRVYAPEEAPKVVKDVADHFPLGDGVTAIGLVFGQSIYTPGRIDIERLQKNDRPYAGWLYVGMVVAQQDVTSDDRTDDDQTTLELDLGVTGDPSLARWAQTEWHELTGAEEPKGWDNQINFEPGIVLTYDRKFRVGYGDLLFTQWDVLPGFSGAIGNIDTHAAVGGTVRWGLNLPRDFGVSTISTTAMECVPCADGEPSLYLFGGAEGRGVIRNIFLDGNTFSDSHDVDKKWGVAEFRGGLAFQWGALRLTYTWVTRSSEFDGQGGWSKYGSASLGLFFDF